MRRKLLAVFVSSTFLWTGVATAASSVTEPAKPAQAATAPQTTTPETPTPKTTIAGNKSPLPAGPARIKTAQGLEDDDLGPGIIILSWAVAVGVAFAVAFSGNDRSEVDTPTTGTN